jgi:hypothetical protein
MKKLITCLLFAAILVFVQCADAAVYYIKWDAAGAADGSTWDDAYTTIQAALNARTAGGDSFAISGGAAGHVYVENVVTMANNSTIYGSTDTGHDGQVEIDGGGGTLGVRTNHTGIALHNVWVRNATSGIWVGTAKSINVYDCIVTACAKSVEHNQTTSVSNLYRCYIADPTATVYGWGAIIGTANFYYCIFSAGGPLYYTGAGANGTVANCIFIGARNTSITVDASGQTVNIYNSIFSSPCVSGDNVATIRRVNGTVNTYNCNILANWNRSQTAANRISGTVTESGSLAYDPSFTAARRGGYITLWVDDLQNWAYFKEIADYAAGIGQHMAFAASGTNATSAGTFAEYATYIAAGHEIACHTRNHVQMNAATAMTITGRSGSTPTITIALDQSDNSSANWSGSLLLIEGGSTVKTIAIAYNTTLAAIQTSINAQAGWTCTGAINTVGTLLADVTDQAVATAHAVQLEQLKFWQYEVAESKAELEAGIGGGYVVETFTPPGNAATAGFYAWLADDDNFTASGTTAFSSARGDSAGSNTLASDINSAACTSYGCLLFKVLSLDAQNHFKPDPGLGVQSIGSMLGWAGGYVHIYAHSAAELTTDQFKDVILRLSKTTGVTIDIPRNIAETITTSGLWTDADSDGLRWIRTYTDAANYALQAKSSMRNAGVNTPWTGVASMTDYTGFAITDSGGNIVAPNGVVDIGAYEFQTELLSLSIAYGDSSFVTAVGGVPPYNWSVDTNPTSGNYTLTPSGTGNVNADITVSKKSGPAIITVTDDVDHTFTKTVPLGSGGTTIILP